MLAGYLVLRLAAGHTFVELPSPLKDPPKSLTTTLAPLDPKNCPMC